jgi:hypothetical protein
VNRPADELAREAKEFQTEMDQVFTSADKTLAQNQPAEEPMPIKDDPNQGRYGGIPSFRTGGDGN